MNQTLPPALYDTDTDYYLQVVDSMLSEPDGFWGAMLRCFDRRLTDLIPGRAVLDLACGEGHLSRRLCAFGPAQITAVDLSSNLLNAARQRAQGLPIQFVRDDAQQLNQVVTASMDIVVSSLAIMDIPSHERLFAAVWRVLRPGGTFVFSMMHPCFEAPFHLRDAPQFMTDDTGKKLGYIIRRYSNTEHWTSGSDTMRGRFGAYHRPLSAILNALHSQGFVFEGLDEPVTAGGDLFAHVPRTAVIQVRRV